MRSPQRLPGPCAPRSSGGSRRCALNLWVRRAAAAAAHLSGFGLSLGGAALGRPGSSLFSWHPVCMTFGFCFCVTEAILIFSPDSSPFFLCSFKAKVRIHWILQVLAALSSSTGLVFIFASKNVSELPHLTSWHSLLGVATMVAVCGQMACGILLLFPQLINAYSVTRLRLYHATCGLVAYLMATATVVSAMCSTWFLAQVSGALWYLCVMLPLVPALVVMHQVNNAFLSKKKIQI